MPQLSMHSSIQDITITEIDSMIVSVDWGWSPFQEPSPVLLEAKRQLDLYFDGELENFDLPILFEGSNHQNTVWHALMEIPYGETVTYGELARKVGSAAQPVGTACGRNPLPILVPCHRVLGANNNFGGYSGDGGLYTKKALLVLEGALSVEQGKWMETMGMLEG